MRMRMIFAILVGCSIATPAHAIDPEQARKVYRGLAKTFGQRKIFYRWQSRASGLNLLRSVTFDEKLQKYFMEMKFNPGTMHGGRGIYAAETLYTSSRFIRGNAEGSLIEIVVEAGTPYIDLEDPEVMRKLQAAGLTGSSAELAELEPSLIVRYRQANVNAAKDWWVIKSPRGVRFQRFNSNRFTLDELRTIYEKIARYGDRDDIRIARQVLVSRLTDEQRSQLGWKKSYFHDIGTVITKAVAPIREGRTPTAEDRRFFAEMVERSDETADQLAKYTLTNSRFIEHPDWTEAGLTKLMESFFLRRLKAGPNWGKSWLEFFARNRNLLLPIFEKTPGLGKAMVQRLHSVSSYYASDRDRELVRLFRDSGPDGLDQLVRFFLGKKSTPGDFVELTQLIHRGLRSKDFEAVGAPLLQKLRERYSLNEEQTMLVDKILPPTTTTGTAKLTRAEKIDAYFASLEQTLKRLGRETFITEEVRTKWIDPFLDLGPTGAELKRLEKQVNAQSFAKLLRKAAYPTTRTAAEFVDFTGSAFDNGRDDYLRLLDEAVDENIPLFLRLKPTDEEMVALVKRIHLRKSGAFERITTALAGAASNPAEFARRIDYERCLSTLRKQ